MAGRFPIFTHPYKKRSNLRYPGSSRVDRGGVRFQTITGTNERRSQRLARLGKLAAVGGRPPPRVPVSSGAMVQDPASEISGETQLELSSAKTREEILRSSLKMQEMMAQLMAKKKPGISPWKDPLTTENPFALPPPGVTGTTMFDLPEGVQRPGPRPPGPPPTPPPWFNLIMTTPSPTPPSREFGDANTIPPTSQSEVLNDAEGTPVGPTPGEGGGGVVAAQPSLLDKALSWMVHYAIKYGQEAFWTMIRVNLGPVGAALAPDAPAWQGPNFALINRAALIAQHVGPGGMDDVVGWFGPQHNPEAFNPQHMPGAPQFPDWNLGMI